MYTVFTDFHHAGLLNSLIMLFEDRLNGVVYRPIGEDWHKKGYWKVFNHPATVKQYLGIGGATPDGTPPLNEVIQRQMSAEGETGVYLCQDIDSGQYNKGITFDEFLKRNIDFVIASIPQHIQPFKKLIREHKPNAKLIYQIGNAWTVEAGEATNIMASAIVNNVPPGVNFVTYHQEFDLDIFKPRATPRANRIFSFINAYSTQPNFAADWQLFLELEKQMDGWEFRSYGGQCRDGAAHGVKQVAEFMGNARFVWHLKSGGDGYGHILHNAFAMGIPPIVKMQHYAGKLGGMLLVDRETCVAVDGLNLVQIINKVGYHSENERYETMRKNVYNRFNKFVSFDKEEKHLRHFLKSCLTNG